jgi:putative membrane protein
MAVTHTFVDFIPSILLGAPDEGSVLSVLPGHRLLLRGRAYEAIRLTAIGGLGSVLICLALLPSGLVLLPYLYPLVRSHLALLLGFVLLILVAGERTWERRLSSLLILALSGILGLLVLRGDLLPASRALFPTLTGLFGISTLLTSLRGRAAIPPQVSDVEEVAYGRGVLLGSFAGLLTGLLPSLSSSQSAVLLQRAFRGEGEKEFLIALGGVNTADAIYALLALYLIGNPRSGASIAVGTLLERLTFLDLLFTVSVFLVAAPLALLITLTLARWAVAGVPTLEYRSLTLTLLLFLSLLTLLLTGPVGLLILITGGAIGTMTPFLGVKRSHCMAVLILPTLLYFW